MSRSLRSSGCLLTRSRFLAGAAASRSIIRGFVAADPHPDHDIVATFRRTDKAAVEAALQVLLLARETGLLRLGAEPETNNPGAESIWINLV